MKHAFLVNPVISVGTEAIAQRLKQVGREAPLPVAVDVAERSGKRHTGRADVNRCSDNLAQVCRAPVENGAEFGSQHQVWQIWIRGETFWNRAENFCRIMHPPFQMRAIS